MLTERGVDEAIAWKISVDQQVEEFAGLVRFGMKGCYYLIWAARRKYKCLAMFLVSTTAIFWRYIPMPSILLFLTLSVLREKFEPRMDKIYGRYKPDEPPSPKSPNDSTYGTSSDAYNSSATNDSTVDDRSHRLDRVRYFSDAIAPERNAFSGSVKAQGNEGTRKEVSPTPSDTKNIKNNGPSALAPNMLTLPGQTSREDANVSARNDDQNNHNANQINNTSRPKPAASPQTNPPRPQTFSVYQPPYVESDVPTLPGQTSREDVNVSARNDDQNNHSANQINNTSRPKPAVLPPAMPGAPPTSSHQNPSTPVDLSAHEDHLVGNKRESADIPVEQNEAKPRKKSDSRYQQDNPSENAARGIQGRRLRDRPPNFSYNQKDMESKAWQKRNETTGENLRRKTASGEVQDGAYASDALASPKKKPNLERMYPDLSNEMKDIGHS
jgi:hypothetical protein